MTTPTRLTIEYIPLADIEPATRNPKRHRVDDIAASIRRVGFIDSIIRDGRTGRLLAGHGRLAALTELHQADPDNPPPRILAGPNGWQVPVQVGYTSASDAEAEAVLVALNRLTEAGGWDDTQLAELLDTIHRHDPQLATMAGFTDAELDRALAHLPTPGAGDHNPDDAPPRPAGTPTSRPGDLWQLGPHRLLVGDATHPDTYRQLLGDDKANIVLTDPPYGVNYVGKTADRLTIGNDSTTGLGALLAAAFGHAKNASLPGACWYVFGPAGPQMLPFVQALADLDVFRQCLVWVKQRIVLGHSDYHYRHESIFTGETPAAEEEGERRVLVHEHVYYGWTDGRHHTTLDRTQDTVWEADSPVASRDHPTMKPVVLLTRALEQGSRPGAVVLDMFGGSGSTLIAAHMTGRVARLAELDPGYADVICRRWQTLTGEQPHRDGQPVDFG